MFAYKIKSELEKIVPDQKIKQILIIGEGRSCASTLESIATQLENYGFKDVDHKKGGISLSIRQDVVDAYKFFINDKNSLLGWRILGNPVIQTERSRHLKNSNTLKRIINGTPSILNLITEENINNLEGDIEAQGITDKSVRKALLCREIKARNVNLRRPLANMEITVCNILNSKGLGADIVFVVGFDQGKFPVKDIASDSEVYQMLVALTRAKKRIYFLNTIGKQTSSFINCLDPKDLAVELIGKKQ
jgi:hypothetical protein